MAGTFFSLFLHGDRTVFASLLLVARQSEKSVVTVQRENDMVKTEHGDMVTIHNVDEIPTFTSEREEADFWSTHELGDEVLSRMDAVADDMLPRPRTRPVPVRFDEDILRRVKALAARRNKGYQTLLKEFVVERLYEEEKREGLIG